MLTPFTGILNRLGFVFFGFNRGRVIFFIFPVGEGGCHLYCITLENYEIFDVVMVNKNTIILQ